MHTGLRISDPLGNAYFLAFCSHLISPDTHSVEASVPSSFFSEAGFGGELKTPTLPESLQNVASVWNSLQCSTVDTNKSECSWFNNIVTKIRNNIFCRQNRFFSSIIDGVSLLYVLMLLRILVSWWVLELNRIGPCNTAGAISKRGVTSNLSSFCRSFCLFLFSIRLHPPRLRFPPFRWQQPLTG